MYESGKRTGGPARQGQTDLTPVTLRVPEVDATVAVQRSLQAHVHRPVAAQRQVAMPVLTAAALQREEEAQLAERRGHLQRQAGELGTGLPVDTISQALQRQAELAPAPLPARPLTAADWVGVLQRYAREHEEKNGTSGLNPREAQQHTALQRQVAQVMAQSLRTDPRPALQRHADFAAQAVTLQRHPLTSMVPRAALGMVTPGERPALQRAVDEAVQADILQRAQDTRALELATVQRQLADVDAEASKPVLDRVQARRGSGNPLPEGVRLHLEQGLNHDLSVVRIHDDAEADRLAKGVNAVAFTTGTDIYFQSGRFNPNTQTGLELLAHEVTHTVQQSKGQVGKGIDPDSGLESEARTMGKRLAVPIKAIPSTPRARLSRASGKVSLQRFADPAKDPIKTSADTIESPKAGINKVGFIKHTDGANIRTAPAELSGSKELTGQPLPPGTKVFVSGAHPQKPEWYYVTATLAGKMLRGYVQGFRVTTNLPEPSATLYFVKKDGETLRPIASSIYHRDVQPGRDLRFYEETVLYLTQQAGLGGARKEGSVQLKKGEFVWLPSPAFANSLAGKVPSGSITGGAVAQAKTVSKRLDDVLASITQSPQHLGKVGKEYQDAIMANLPQIIGVTAAFMAAEGLSVLLAATPTGIGQLAAAAIQVSLGAWAAYGAAEAVHAALPYAQKWLMNAWKANGDAKQIAIASENFVYMVVQIALAAMALLGARGNIGKGMKLAENVKITPPGLGMAMAVTSSGQGIVIPVFKPGSITATGTAAVKPGMGSVGPASSKVNPEEQTPATSSELEKALANKSLTDDQLEALLQKTKNWDQLKNYIGMKADKGAAPPPGYEWYSVEGKTLIRRMKGNKASGEYAPLTVKDGVVVLNAGGSNRISVYSRYRKNFLDYAAEQAKTQGKDGDATRRAAERLLAQTAADGRPLYQLHHMIPDNVAQAHALVQAALKKVEGYTVDRGSNMFALPRRLRPGEPYIHNGSHARYDAWVGRELDTAMNKLVRDKMMPLDKIDDANIDQALRQVENRIRQKLQDRDLPADVWDELETGGRKISQIEPLKNEEVGYA